MEVRKLCFLSSCQYTHGGYTPASWAARHTTVCLDYGSMRYGFHHTSQTNQVIMYTGVISEFDVL